MASSAEVIRRRARATRGFASSRGRCTCATSRALKDAGADTVYSGEGEVALAFIEDILDSLGATPEQIDRERERAHAELFGESPAAH